MTKSLKLLTSLLLSQVNPRERRTALSVQRTGPQPSGCGTFQVCEGLSAAFWVCFEAFFCLPSLSPNL